MQASPAPVGFPRVHTAILPAAAGWWPQGGLSAWLCRVQGSVLPSSGHLSSRSAGSRRPRWLQATEFLPVGRGHRRRGPDLLPQPALADGRHAGSQSRWLGRRSQSRRVGRRGSFTQLTQDLARNPNIFVGEVLVVVIISIFFESLEHTIYKKLDHNDKIGVTLMNVLFKEITLVGFVMFTIFIVLHTGVADGLVKAYPLMVTFETVRMIMFMVINVLVMQAIALWLGGQRIIKQWSNFELTRSFGTNPTSMESQFCKGGFLTRVLNPEARNGVSLMIRRPLEYGSNLLFRVVLRRNKLRKLINFRAIRHEFLFPSVASPRVPRVPDPATFSFESYLAKRLGSTLIQLISVDTWTWFATLAFLAPCMYFVRFFSWVQLEATFCAFAWGLVLAGIVLVCCLEEDIYRLTPVVPDDLRMTLKIFAGESLQMLRRQRMPSWKQRSLSGRRYRPGLGDAEGKPRPALGRPPAMRSPIDGGCGRVLSSEVSTRLGRLLAHFQAIAVASLFILQLIRSPAGRLEWVFYLSSWAAWPVMLYLILPLILRRLTMLRSIELEKDVKAIRLVTLEHQDALLRDFKRLVQLLRFEYHASHNGEAWIRPSAGWERDDQIKAVAAGNQLFDTLAEEDKEQVFAIFASWDPANTGVADLTEVDQVFKLLGFGSDREGHAASLLRLVDFDASGTLTWMKFKAIIGLATIDRPKEEVMEDLTYFFNLLDVDKDGMLTTSQLADGLERTHIGVKLEDLENLLFLFYGAAKPKVTLDEFLQFNMATNRMSAMRSIYDYTATH